MLEEEILVKRGFWTMPLINKDRTLYLTPEAFDYRLHSYFKEYFDSKDILSWYVEFFDERSVVHLLNHKALPLHELNLIRTKQCMLVMNNSHEAFHAVVDAIYDICVLQLNIPPEQILLLSESATIDHEVEKISKKYNLSKIKTHWIRQFEHNIAFHPPADIQTLAKKHYDKKFLSLNRIWRAHRPALVSLLKINNLLDLGYVSLARASDNKDWNFFEQEVMGCFHDGPELQALLLENMDIIKNIPELLLDQADMTYNHSQTPLDSTYPYYENTYFSVVTETNYFKYLGEGVQITEKIVKCIHLKHPFIVVSRPHTLKFLRSIGYLTYEPIINESYDDEENDFTRLLMIVDEIKRLCNMDDSQLEVFLEKAREITDYNYTVLKQKTKFLSD